MIVPDVNLLLYAILTAFPQHERARTWWEDEVNGRNEIGISQLVIFGFLRIATNSRIQTSPMHVDVAIETVREWLRQPNIRLIAPRPEHLDIAFGLLESVGTAANLTTDVQLAALAIEHKAQLYSHDTDFGRFAGLRWVDPLA